MIGLYIPPPPFRDLFHIGGFELHVYSLTMVAAIVVAFWWSARRAVRNGGDLDAFESIGFVAVVCGIIGARAYHVITEHARYFGPGMNPWNIFAVWNGGLGVIGSIIGGAIGVWAVCRWKGIPTWAVADAIAPTLFVAQAIGRVGNYFNQEAFGLPTTLPWGLKVSCDVSLPSPYTCDQLFHPTFLYEGIWNLIGCFLLLWLIRRFGMQNGKAICFYVLWYSFGRFFIELIRIDPVHMIDGIRVNNWTDGAIFVLALISMIILIKMYPGRVELPLAGMGEKWRAKRGAVANKAESNDTDDGGNSELQPQEDRGTGA